MVRRSERAQYVSVYLLVTLLAHAAYAAENAKPARAERAQPDFSYYHTKARLLREVQRITNAHPDVFKVRQETRVSGNYTASVRVVTASPGGFSGDPAQKLRAVLDFGEHGREFVSSETGLRLLQLLASEAELAEFCERQEIELDPLRRALQHTVLEVLPMENERGRDRVETKNLCERKNGRGVDTNRNWPVHWGFKEPDYDSREEYPGEEPFSEPEAAAVRDIAVALRPHAWVNVHSGMEGLFMPYDHVARMPDGADAAASLAVLQELNRTACGGRCVVGSGGESVGYLAHGTATDWMHEELHVPMAFTWEIYGNMTADFHDCFRMFNPLDEVTLRRVVDDWAGAALRLVMLMPAHPAVKRDLPGLAAALKQPLSEPHGNVTRAGSSEAVLVARQRTLDESTGRRWGAAEQARRGAGSASGLLNARLLLVPAVMFSYLMVRIARKSALWKTVTRIHRSALRRQTVLPI